MMIFNIIMIIANLTLILAFYYNAHSAIENKNNKYFGVKININEHQKLQALIANYQKSNKILLSLLLIIVAISIFYQSTSFILLTHALVFFACFGFYPIMMKYTMDFDQLIIADPQLFDSIDIKKTRKVDLYLASKADDYQFINLAYALFLPLFSSLYMLFQIIKLSDIKHIDHSYQTLYIVMLVTNIVLIICSIIAANYIKNSKQITYTNDSAENAALNFNKKSTVINIIYLAANINVLANLLFVITFRLNAQLAIAIMLIVAIITLSLVLQIYKKMKDRDYSEEDTLGNWLYGIFYYNKANPKLMVNTRFGFGTTMNMAKTSAKLISLSIFVFIIVSYSYLIYTPLVNDLMEPSINKTAEQLFISSPNYSYAIDTKQIESIELMDSDKLKILLKTNGIGTENYRRGYYDTVNFGNCFICHYKSSAVVILIKNNDKNIIYSEKTTDATEQTYHRLIDE